MRQRPFGAKLAVAFDEHDLLVDRATYDHVRATISAVGRADYGTVAPVLGDDWRAVDDAEAVFSDSDFRRVLGFGHAMSDFVLAPLSLPPAEHAAAVEVGNLANLIVTVFDDFVDEGYPPGDVLSPVGLHVGMLGNAPLRWIHDRVTTPVQSALVSLVAAYYERLNALPYADVRPTVSERHDTVVADMYRAERDTVTELGSAETDHVVSAYPFVTMGVVGWLASSTFDDDRFQNHLEWTADLGRFVGLVDDAADLEHDRQVGEYNSVAERRSEHVDAVVLADIAADGRDVLSAWQSLIGDVERREELEAYFRTCLTSWLGGRSVVDAGLSERY